MKARTNGAAPQAAKATNIGSNLSDLWEQRRKAHRDAAHTRAENTTKKLTVEVDVQTYGLLCAGALVHGVSLEEVAGELIREKVCDWANDDYYFSI